MLDYLPDAASAMRMDARARVKIAAVTKSINTVALPSSCRCLDSSQWIHLFRIVLVTPCGRR